MSGTTSVQRPITGAYDGSGNSLPPSVVNEYRINAVADRLSSYIQPGKRSNPEEFINLCLSLSRGIDYAIANNEIPANTKALPPLLKQICQRKDDAYLVAALMVLMISVKNACKVGWFLMQEAEELITMATEMGNIFCSMGEVDVVSSARHSTVSKIMERFYPTMTLDLIVGSTEAKPGYGAYGVDFHITKSTAVPMPDKIWLLVAQIDNIETSACLISPQQVSFLINGKGVDGRTNILMDTGPQMPTNVTGMLKYGTNLLQAVGQFDGHYVMLIAYMSATSLPDNPVLQDYVQPDITSVDSDSDIIEGPSQISLNCPISFTRIKTPVKGRSCKHFQCFDFNNFIDINSRRPSWRCPHCNQYVCFADIRLDRNMFEVLKEVGDNVVEVILSADGSWKAVLENDHSEDKIKSNAHNFEKEQTELQEYIGSPTVPNIFDLTNDDDRMEIMDTSETVDKKPFQASVHGQSVTPNSTSLGMNSAGVNQNFPAQIDGLWSGVNISRGGSDTPTTVGVPEDPVLTNAVSPAFSQEAGSHGNNPAANSVMLNQLSAPNSVNSVVNEYGRSSSIPRNINRTIVAVQALPVQSQALGPQISSRTNLNSLMPSSVTATHVSPSSPATVGFNAILSDAERQQHFSRSPINLPPRPGVNSSPLHRHSATQNRVPPVTLSAPGQSHNPYRAPGFLSELQNPHLHQALNSRSHPVNQSSSTIRSSNPQRSHVQQGGSQTGIVQAAGATVNSQQTRFMAPSQVARQSQAVSVQNQTSIAATSLTVDSFQGLTGGQRENVGGTAQPVSKPDGLLNLQSEQIWRPNGRMRGSLTGRPFSDAVRQQIIVPTQPTQSSRPQDPQFLQSSRPQGPQTGQSSRPQGPQAARPTDVSPQLNVLISNRSAQNFSSST